jgi:hypothetical protein
MDTLSTLATVLSLGFFSGLNLYAVIFVSGLAIRFNWLTLSPGLQSLHTLAHPAVLITSGVLYLVEFIADKVPWVDNTWDAIHTAIRPIGAAFLALHVMGDQDPVIRVVAALLCGSLALTSHAAKAGTRLTTNFFSPAEPLSNTGLSIAEDAIVIGSLYFVYHYPYVALGIVFVFLLFIAWFAPRLYRAFRSLFRKKPSPAVT